MGKFKEFAEYFKTKQEKRMNIDELTYSRYVRPEDNAIRRINIMNWLSDKKIFLPFKIMYNLGECDIDYWNVNRVFREFSVSEEYREKPLTDLIEEVISGSDFIKNITIDEDDMMIFDTEDGKIRLQRMSDVFNVTEQHKKILMSSDKEHTCHWSSIGIIRSGACDDFEKPCLATARHDTFSDKWKYLHTWVEFDCNGKPVCADYAHNLVASRDWYYRLLHINPEEVSRISAEGIKEEYVNLTSACEKFEYFVKYYLDDRENAWKKYDEELSSGMN